MEPLGPDAVKAVLASDRKQALLDLVAEDMKYAAEANGIDEVCKLVRFYSNFGKLLNNYVNFSEFYARNSQNPAIFEAGKLYIDQRCCELCVEVKDMGAHGDMAGLSGMFLIYCTCTSKAKDATKNIVAVLTAGSISDLRPGKHGVFYDLEGNDWDATITSIVDNPISVRQAFWSPYRKLGNFLSEKINKSAADKESSSAALLQTKAEEGAAKQPFDVSKFASMFAMIGIALAAIGAAFAAIVKAVQGLAWWKWLIIIAAIMLIVSAPACFIAWKKLRKRNLGPVLNANGWAINSKVLVNILFGKTLTSVAKYPKIKMKDPYSMKTPAWKKWLFTILLILIAAFVVLYFTDNLQCIGISRL